VVVSGVTRGHFIPRHGGLICRLRRAVLAAALLASPGLAACAEWQGALGPGVQRVDNTEFDKAGTTLVRETGWLPGVTARLVWQGDRLGFFVSGEAYQHGLAYHGQTQAGAPVQSTSATRLIQLRTGASYGVNARIAGFVAGEWDSWRRRIEGAAGAAGLQERSLSTRFLLGARGQWDAGGVGFFGMDGALVVAGPERLDVGFSGLLDAAALTTRRARGWRFGASMRPLAAPRLELRVGFDTITVARSGDAPLRRNGQFIGTVAQPEHRRQATSVTLSALF
jgi:hypothetical protein